MAILNLFSRGQRVVTGFEIVIELGLPRATALAFNSLKMLLERF
jgi:hypothetical protein